ncbi:hypothetical protein B0H16DRAFT_1271026, partial [Mycena metata]
TRGLISGSIALLMVTDLEFEPGDIDLYVPLSQEDTAIRLCIQELDFVQTESRDSLYDNSSSVKTVHWLENSSRRMNIIVVENENPAVAVFRFHSTVVMNFLCSRGLYCAYPSLTLYHLSIPNSGLMMSDAEVAQKCRDCFEKYRERGIRFERDPRTFPGHGIHACFVDAECTSTIRSTED